MKVAPRLGRSTDGFGKLQQIRKNNRRVRRRNPDDAELDDLECRDLLRGSRAQY
jgi:hypothetical protein